LCALPSLELGSEGKGINSNTQMAITVIIGGLVSKASGGDFYQGAMSALVVYLYNKMGHESRKDIVLKRARALLKNPAVLKKYKIVLEKLLNSNSVLYVDKLITTASVGNLQKKAEFLGVTAKDFSYIKIGGKCFDYWISIGKPEMIGYQLDHTILHEVKHVMIRNNKHMPGFDKEIGDMGFGYGY